ncbi:MAG: LLM class flavin-dependent oxidoreductase [Nocardioidaceae bacterium]
MNGPRVGLSLPLGAGVGDAAGRAERLGFDYVSVGEHLAFHGPSANGFVALAAAAGATRRIGLLSSVTLAPLYPAALLAKLVASLDDVSGGRFTLGIGVGGEHEAEFDAVGVPKAQRGARTDEAITVVRRLLAEDDVRFDGRFTTLSGLTIQPRPKGGTVPVWVAGRSVAAMRRAALLGDGWMPYLYTPQRLADSVRRVRSIARDENRGSWSGQVAAHLFTTVHPDGARARRTAVEQVSGTYRQDFGPLADRYLVHGDAQTCARRVREYVDAGAGTIVLRLAAPADELYSMTRRVAEELVPALAT